ncbi:MAG TPA: asparagine synthase C-terminal domain-containing protein, partial [Cyclobacteriaceae bacterium]|nr:asparagine synthase C-terminal domain-containing protein [Cyclobacteriaceae bacterium]
LGFFLSSGVDSSLLAAITNKHFKGRPFDFFTVAFDQKTISDESDMALDYLNGFKNPDLRHHKLTINPQFVASKFDSMYNYVDEPFGDPATLLNWSISEKAREHATVVLSGDGADEMFWGYPRYNQWRVEMRRPYKKIPYLKSLASFLSHFPEGPVKYSLLNMLDDDPVDTYFNLIRPRLFGFLPRVSHQDNLWCLKGIASVKHRNDLVELLDVKAYLADAMLYKVDRASMASSLEVRVPFLDNRVIDYALTLPLSSKSTPEYHTKAPLKKLLHQLAPHYDLTLPKKGFNFPLEYWLRNEWRDRVLSTITKENLEAVGLPASPYINIVNRFYADGLNAANEVWYLLNLIQWHQHAKSFK